MQWTESMVISAKFVFYLLIDGLLIRNDRNPSYSIFGNSGLYLGQLFKQSLIHINSSHAKLNFTILGYRCLENDFY